MARMAKNNNSRKLCYIEALCEFKNNKINKHKNKMYIYIYNDIIESRETICSIFMTSVAAPLQNIVHTEYLLGSNPNATSLICTKYELEYPIYCCNNGTINFYF